MRYRGCTYCSCSQRLVLDQLDANFVLDDKMRIVRFLDKPIITSQLDEKVGKSINGATLIRVP